MRLPRAILFDLDDTILDTTDSATRVWRQTAEAFAGEIGHEAAHIDQTLERSRRWYWSDPQRNQAGRLDLHNSRRDVTHQGLLELGIDNRDLAHRFAEHYSNLRIDSMRPFPGAIQTLRHFRERGVRLALISNGHGPSQRRKVRTFGLEPLFDVILIEGEAGYGKPNPRIYHRAIEACGNARPDQAWCVGDNLDWEVAAPQQLGMSGVWVDWEGVGLPDGCEVRPDRVVRRIAELVEG